MTALRLIPLPVHSALEMLLGIVVGAALFAGAAVVQLALILATRYTAR